MMFTNTPQLKNPRVPVLLHMLVKLEREREREINEYGLIHTRVQVRSQVSLLPVPTERERRVGEKTWERG